MENHVLGRLPKQGAAGMHVDRRTLDESLVALLRVFSGGVAEEARAERLTDFHGVAAAGDDGVLVAFHDGDELLADVLCSPHVTGLDEVFEAPGAGEFRILPAVVDVE